MTKDCIHSIAVLAALGAGLCCTPARALDLDDQLVCKTDAHTFIQPLLDDQYIDPNPMRVESNSVNAFRPKRGRDLTAFGFHVYAVFGYQQDDPMFKRGSGEPLKGSLYGAVVSGNTAEVAKAIANAGSPAESKHAGPFLTAIYCRAQ